MLYSTFSSSGHFFIVILFFFHTDDTPEPPEDRVAVSVSFSMHTNENGPVFVVFDIQCVCVYASV